MLRMSNKINDEEKIEKVNEILAKLFLINCKSTVISRLSSGETKRLAFASALLTNPSILLLDEPTSSLDTYLAKSLMSIIRSITVENNQVTVVILHQPTDTMFDLIDQICLLVENGKQAFFGDKSQAMQFFTNQCRLSSLSLHGFIEQLSLPGEFIDEDEHLNVRRMVATEYSKSEQSKSMEMNINYYIDSTDRNSTSNKLKKIERGKFHRQLKWLLWRSLVSGRRNPKRTNKLIIRLLIMAIIVGTTFFHLRKKPSDYVSKVNALFVVALMALLEANMSLMLVEIPNERVLMTWEYRRQLYSVGAYYLSRLVIDTGYNVITSVIYMNIILLLAGLSRWIFLTSITILITMSACSVASFISSLSSTPQIGLLALQPTQNLLANLNGFFINLNSIPAYIRWMKYFSYTYYGYNLFLSAQWHQSDLCYNLTLLSNQTCEITGNDILQCLGVNYEHSFEYAVGLVSIFAGFHFLSFLIIFFRTKYSF